MKTKFLGLLTVLLLSFGNYASASDHEIETIRNDLARQGFGPATLEESNISRRFLQMVNRVDYNDHDKAKSLLHLMLSDTIIMPSQKGNSFKVRHQEQEDYKANPLLQSPRFRPTTPLTVEKVSTVAGGYTLAGTKKSWTYSNV